MNAQRIIFARKPAARRLAFASTAAALSMLLAGCDMDRVSALEERMTAVEAKADAAEKRAKAAESLAATNQPQPIAQPDPVPQTNDNPDPDDPGSAIDDGSDQSQPPSMADNGTG